jgi:hypothetical protein
MIPRRAAIATTTIAMVVIIIILVGAIGLFSLASKSNTSKSSISSTTSNSSLSTRTSIMNYATQGSGPISTYPASWTDVCGLPVHGNTTTDNEIASSFNPGVANFSLTQVYSKIVNSASFKNVSSGRSWVTTSWTIQMGSAPPSVVGQFVLLSANHPDGYVQANYDLQTGGVTVIYQTGLISSCPAEISSSSGATLTEPSPAYYAVGAPVGITFYVVDDTVSNMSVWSPSSCLGNFTILQGIGMGGPIVYDSTKHPECGGTPLNVTLNPGQSYNQTRVWNQTNDAGAQVPPGAYEATGIVAGSPNNYSSPTGELYVGTPPVPVNSSVLQRQFYYEGYAANDYVSTGQPVKIVWVLTNNGQLVYDLKTSACSFSYKILNLKDVVVFDSAKRSSCDSRLEDNIAPPMGGISHESYWNQTDSSGGAVAPGFYRAIIDLHVVSGGTSST